MTILKKLERLIFFHFILYLIITIISNSKYNYNLQNSKFIFSSLVLFLVEEFETNFTSVHLFQQKVTLFLIKKFVY